MKVAGVVVGSSNVTEGGFRHAFVWRDGVMSDLGTPGVESEATAINRRGGFVGWSRVAGGRQRAVRWVNGTIEDLGVEGANSQARGINDFGVIVGASKTPAGDLHAFRWEKGVMVDLGTGGQMPPSEAGGINDKDEIVGSLRPVPDSQGSDLEQRMPFLYSHGVLTELGNLGLRRPRQQASASTPSSWERWVQDPFDEFGTQDAWVWENGVFTLLPELSDGNSRALGVNRRGEIVGYSFGHAVIWRR